MRVSVVVIGLNEAKGIEPALRSAKEAVDRLVGGGEVIYVDAGSSDGSRSIAGSIPGVRLAPEPAQMLNAAAARNCGLALASGDWVQFLDGDMTLEPDWLDAALDHRGNRDVAGIGGVLIERELFRTPWNLAFGSDWPVGAEAEATLGGAGLWARSALLELGGFDASLPVGEDPDLSLRARRAGWRVVRLPIGMATHDLGLESFRGYLRRAVSVGVSQAHVARRHGAFGGARRRALRAPLRSSVALLSTGAAVLSGSWLPVLPALGLWMRQALRETAGGRSPSHAFVHATHVFFVDLPIAWGWVRAAGSGAVVSLRDKFRLAPTSQGISAPRQ